MSGIVKNLIFAVAAAGSLWLGYSVFFGEETVQDQAAALSESQIERESAEFFAVLQELRTIDFSGGLFVDPRFNALIDFRQDVTPEPVGRSNPFAPLE